MDMEQSTAELSVAMEAQDVEAVARCFGVELTDSPVNAERTERLGAALFAGAAAGHTGACELLVRAGGRGAWLIAFHTAMGEDTCDDEAGRCDLLLQIVSGSPWFAEELAALLVEAGGSGHADLCRRLLSAGAEVNRRMDDSTPLSAAAANGHVGVCRALLAAGADPLARVRGGVSAIHLAAGAGQIGAVELLI